MNTSKSNPTSMVLFGFGIHIIVRSLGILLLGPNPTQITYELAYLLMWIIVVVITWGPDFLASRSGKEPLYSPRQFMFLSAVATGGLTSGIFLIIVLLGVSSTSTPVVMLFVGSVIIYFTSHDAVPD